MIKIYRASSVFEVKDYIDKRYNNPSSVNYVDKIYPDIFLPKAFFELKEMWKFDPEYMPHLYISENMKPVFEEHFSDSGYFVGEVMEFYPRPQEGKVVRGYYKWIIKNVFQCEIRNKKYYSSEPLKWDIFAMCDGEFLMFREYGFSNKAIRILLGEGICYFESYQAELCLEGEDDE